MPGWMFDSVALIDYYHGRPGVAPYVEMILNGGATGAFSTVVVRRIRATANLEKIILFGSRARGDKGGR